MNITRGAFSSLLVVTVAGAPGLTGAQTPWVDTGTESAFTVEAYKPVFESDETTALTSVWYTSVFWRLSPNVRVVAELPLANGGAEGIDSEFGIGNIYGGFEVTMPGSAWAVQAGLRLPTSSDNIGTSIGLITDLIDRPGGFGQDLVTVVTRVTYTSPVERGFGVRALVGPHLLIPTEGGGDAELFSTYSILAGYFAPEGSVSAGPTGLIGITTEGSLGERTLHQLGIAGQLNLGVVRPGAVIRIPLDDDYRDFMDVVFGLNVAIVPGAGRP